MDAMLPARPGTVCAKRDTSVGVFSRMKKSRRPATTFDPEAFLQQTGVGRTVVELKKNQVLFAQGDSADAVFYIQKGTVKLTVLSPRGKEAALSLLTAGSFVGEQCVAGGETTRTCSATAIARTTTLRIQKKEMIRVLHEQRAFADMFVAFL